jgi:hypothetical protein
LNRLLAAKRDYSLIPVFQRGLCSAAEQARYQEMMKADPLAARAYIDTRNYVSVCQQALKQLSRILETGIQPKDYDVKYATPEEANMVKQAISLWMKATIAQ